MAKLVKEFSENGQLTGPILSSSKYLWFSCVLVVSLAFVVAGVSLGITSWSVRGSDDFRYLGAALGVTNEFAHWEMRWPAYGLQRVALDLFGANPSGIWMGRWLVWGAILLGIGFLGHVVYGRWAAVWSIVLLGFCPILVIPVSQGWIDSIEAGWCSVIIAMLFLLYRHNDTGQQSWLAALLGVALGMAMISRITSILILPTVGLVWWWMGRPWRLMAIVGLGVAAVLVIDVVYLSNLLGDGFARWRHLGTVRGGYEAFNNSELLAPPASVRLTYGLPRVLLGGSPIVNAWLTWLLGCGSLIALGLLLNWRISRRLVGPLILATLLGVLVLLLRPTPRGTFALRLLPRYYVFAAPLLGVGAVVSLLLLIKQYPSAKIGGLVALLGACAFYIGFFLLPERYYSTPLRDGMTQALYLAQNASPGQVVVTDERTARLLSQAAQLHGWPELVWMNYKQWTNERIGVDAFILLDVPHGHNAAADHTRAWLTENGGHDLVNAKNYSRCSKLRLWSCVPDWVAIAAVREPISESK
jgi:4-amino-4-deoxy-L-arabinose transferase-like glycosyltransferase